VTDDPRALPKPSIVQTLKGLGATEPLDDSPHGWKSMRCPFHGDTGPSASYNTVLQRFRCHKCGDDISGDGYDVIQGVERCDFATAKARASDFCGVITGSIPQSVERSRLTSKRNKERSRLVRAKYKRR
jgi:DNA primase